ncbi:helix-turn-helix domain-containing protein [Dehalococcoidia bacterium]|nr:helix-turn-helix domain-containing protein [Dehalococcoidia bacterium]
MMQQKTEKRAYTMQEASAYLGGVSRPTLYKLISDGDLRSFHIGTRRYFTKESLDDYINDRIDNDLSNDSY